MSSSDDSPVYGETITLTATVTGSNPTGTVAFTRNGNTSICSAAVVSGSGNSRTAKCNWQTRVTPDVYPIIAKYSGDTGNSASTSSELDQNVFSAQTTVTATISPNPPVLNSPAKVTVTVSPVAPASGTPTGTVNVTYGSLSCTFNLPNTNNCSVTPRSTGSFDLNVVYQGDDNFDGNGFSKTNIVVVPATTTTLVSSKNPGATGDNITFNVSVMGNSPTGRVFFQDGGNPLCSPNGVLLDTHKASCSTAALASGSHNITASYSGDSNNGASSASLTQVIQDGPSVNLDQQGITGFWYNPNTNGQGFLLQVFPDLNGVNNGLLAGGWFTFDIAPIGGFDKQRWYSISGSVSSVATTSSFVINSAQDGNFNAGPIVSAFEVGQGTLRLSDCTHGTLTYQFSDGSGRSGSIPLTRVTANVACAMNGDNGTAPSDYLLSGAWYDPNTSGQGLLFDVNPIQSNFAAAWYTYAPNGESSGPAGQRWYTLQVGFNDGNSVVDNIPIYASYGGVFDNGTSTTQLLVGTAKIVFSSCSAASLTYAFSATVSDNHGLNGTINLQRLGPAPPGCHL